jgi:hypothetical protein
MHDITEMLKVVLNTTTPNPIQCLRYEDKTCICPILPNIKVFTVYVYKITFCK